MDSHLLIPGELVGEVSTIGGFSLSPDGSLVTFSRQTTGDSQIYISPFNDFKPEILTSGNGFKYSPRWSPDGQEIAYLQYRDGDGCYNIYIISPSGGSCRKVTDLPKGAFRGLEWSPDGRHLAFSSNCRNSFNIYTVQADGSDLLRLTSGSETDLSPQWSPDGDHLLFVSFAYNNPRCSEIRMINRDGSGLRSIGPSGGISTGGCWSPDGTRIAFTSDATGDFNIGIVDVKTGELSWVTREDNGVWASAWSPDGKSMACQMNRNGSYQIIIIDLETGRTRMVGPREGLSSSVKFTPDGAAIVFTHEGPRNPDELCHLSLESSELSLLTNGLPDTIDRQRLVAPEEISYSSFDGLEIPSLIFRPFNTDSDVLPPAVVWVHGGPNYQFFNKWNPSVQLLVSHGYLVMAPDFRGSMGYGRKYRDLSIGDWGGGDLKDVIAAADYLESTGQADGSRIALWGGSYGGYLMLMALAKAPDRWAACVNFFGFVDLETFYRSSQGILKYVKGQIGTPEENHVFYHERSPITHCEKITAPLLFFQGADDTRVPLSQAKQLMSVLESHNKLCELIVYEGEGHGFQKRDNQIDSLRRGVDFLNRHVAKL